MKPFLSIGTVLFFAGLILLGCERKSKYSLFTGYEIISDNGGGTGTTTWTRDKSYLLDGFVFVNDGQVLTIEAGTIIRGKTGQGENASALIVARGAKIIAEGSSIEPIIFTCEGDDLEGSVPTFSKGLWGGLIILGFAPLNNALNEAQIEGIPTTEPRGIFGGSKVNDNSGILKYVSIRHGGTNIGSENEINGLTLGGVGNATMIEFIEVISNYDDGIEFFGGTVNSRYVVSAFNGDDAFDYDLGYQGSGQFWLGIEDHAEGDLLIEGSGGEDPETGLPYSQPIIYNGTFIGRGSAITNRLVKLDRFAGCNIGNSIFIEQYSGICIQYKENGPSCFDQFQNGNLQLKNNIFWNVANNNGTDIFRVFSEAGVDITNQSSVFAAYFMEGGNTLSNPGIEVAIGKYLILPTGNISDNLAEPPGSWFKQVNYKGAFLYDNWARNWTLLHQDGWIE